MDTYKQKYKEALERAKTLQKTCDSQAVVGWCEYLFPELAESEDEKIRKAIVKIISDIDGGFPFEKHGIIKKKALAWLEKQSEKPQRMISAEAKEALYNKPTWSEDDEKNYKDLMDEIVCLGNRRNSANRLYYNELIAFIKKLKNKIINGQDS